MKHINWQPVDETYRNMMPYRAFSFLNMLDQLDENGIVLVAFSALIKESASEDKISELKGYDERAQIEAQDQDGFIMYRPDEISVERAALSFCLWETLLHAREASAKPHHVAAVRHARTKGHEVYEHYKVFRYLMKPEQELGSEVLHVLEIRSDGTVVPIDVLR